MDNIDNVWLDLLDTAVDKLHTANGNWSDLTEKNQELAALWRLEADMNNGGFVQFFCNWGIDCYKISTTALKKIGADKMLEIIESEFKIIDAVYSRSKDNLREYWDIAKYITDTEIEELDRLDSKFWKYPDNISQLGYEYYKA